MTNKYKKGQIVKVVDYELNPHEFIGMTGVVTRPDVGYYIQVDLGNGRKPVFKDTEIELIDLEIFNKLGT